MKIYQSIGNKKKVKDMICISEKNFQDSPGPRVKNPPASAGYMASIPGPGRPHKLGGGSRGTKPVHLNYWARGTGAGVRQQEKSQ